MHHFASRVQKQVSGIRGKQKALYSLALLLFFFAIFDSVLSYALPLLFTQSGLSKSQMGLVLGFSSIAGAVFDIILSKFLKNTNFRRMFLFMLAGCAIFFTSLFASTSVFVYLFAMAVWGLYWNLLTYGLYNFISTKQPEAAHASSWGVLDIFKGLGLVVAPLLAGLAIGETVGTPLFATAFFVLAMVYLSYVLLLKVSSKPKTAPLHHKLHILRRHGFWKWMRILRILFPVLALYVLLCLYDLSLATIGPLVSEELGVLHQSGGFFLTLYHLPSVFMLWTVGNFTKKFGKKKVAFIGFGIGASITGLFAFLGLSLLLLPLIFVASLISAMAWPALKGAFADYISESPDYEKEIEILIDFMGNIGCVLGPIFAGVLADIVGNLPALSMVGVFCGISSFVLLRYTPKQIKVQ